ncbi:MAG: HlyD family efflux transporter periplasmic adaptor subunit [Synechococcales bacterium]|nr:HlyD family efflux transporter periplasmic adaptor subunit [Synechococcales bacterium]
MIRTVIIRTALVGVVGICSACTSFSQAQPEMPEIPEEPAEVTSVVALGRLVPRGEVIKLSVSNAQDSRVNQLLVEEGDWVEAGQVIAVLQGFDRRERDLEEARKTVEYYQARLDQIQSGDAKEAEIAAQEANIARLEAQLRNEQAEREASIASAEAELRQADLSYQRNLSLQEEGAVSAEALDQAQESLETARANLEQRRAQLNTTVQTLEEQITQERENLARLREVRPVDVRVAKTELERAMIAVEQRQADLEDGRVRVPVAGQILRINTRVGEQVNTQQGIVELGQTDEMYAIAEVYETEITQVQPGQTATITSEYGGFAGDIRGTVEQIGLQVGTRTLSEGSSNPTTDENTRVVEVKIRINADDSPKVAGLTNMQVRVVIDVAPPS